MKTSVVAALGAAMIAALAAGAAAEAATVNFGVVAFGGSILFIGSSLDQSTILDLDLSSLIVNEVSADDDSGLALFDSISLSAMTSPPSSQIIYGSGTGPASLGADVILSWPVGAGPGIDTFTETLTTVMSINRGTTGEIGLQLTGTLSDTAGDFKDTPVLLSLTASQSGPTVGVEFTNMTSAVTPSVPEPSTWMMMALGFGALGYAGFRRRNANIAVFFP
jgi:PEP-CTERM motif